MKCALSSLVCLLCLTMIAASANSHTRLTSPTPRDDNDGHKSGPCGNAAKGTPMELNPGDTVTVNWLETVNHPGYYRIALSMAGDAGFDDNVLSDNILDEDCQATPCSYSTDVTLPMVECEDCTLQLIQYMGTAAPYSPYFSCADLRIGMGGGQDSDAGTGGDGDGSAQGGCQVSGSASGGALGSFAFLCLMMGFGARRRRP